MESVSSEVHKEVEEWQGTGHEFIERFAKIERKLITY